MSESTDIAVKTLAAIAGSSTETGWDFAAILGFHSLQLKCTSDTLLD